MHVAFLIVAGLLAAFALAGIAVVLSRPAARAVIRKPVQTRRSLVLQTALLLVLFGLDYLLHPGLPWAFAILAICTVVQAALHWPEASRR